MDYTDEVLIKQTLLGDRESFHSLVRKYQGMVCGLAYHKVGNFEDAQELAQEAFLCAYRDLHRLENPNKFSNWLHSITSNTCISWRRRRRLDTVPLESESYVSEIMDESPTPEEAAMIDEQNSFVHNAMKNLPESQRLAVTLYYMDGLSVNEVSDFLDIPVGTVKSRLYKGREKLKGELMKMIEQEFAKQRPGDEFANKLQERIDAVLEQSTQILGELFQKKILKPEDIQRVKSMAGQFAATPAIDIEIEDLWRQAFDNTVAQDRGTAFEKVIWQQVFDSIIGQDRDTAFEQVMQLFHQSADLEMWGWQLYAVAALDVLKMAEEDEERKPSDINVLMGYTVGQHASEGRFEWRSSDWHCMSWGDLGLFEEIYRMGVKIPMEHLEVGTSWCTEKLMSRSGDNLHEITIEADDDTIEVPAGKFENCLRVSTMISAQRLGKRKDLKKWVYWMAPGIGMVKFTSKVFDRPKHDREIVLKEYSIPEPNQSYFPLLIGSRWHYDWDSPRFNAPTSEVYRLLCQKGENFYFSRARYIYGNFSDSEVGKMVAAKKKEDAKK